MHALVLVSINQHMKFVVPSFIRSKDMTRAQKLKMAHVIMAMTLSGMVCHPKVKT